MTSNTSHSLYLDQRQRDMLAAMGVTVWWPDAHVAANQSGHAPPEQATTRVTSYALAQAHAQGRPDKPKSSDNATEKTIALSAENTVEYDRLSNKFLAASTPHSQPTSPQDWPELTHAIQHCTACRLCSGRQQAVVGMGNLTARWLIVGETPDNEEDRQGRPFVGPVGQLLDAMLAAMGLTREADVYLTNVIKCPPPHGRKPDASEVAQCAPYLHRQIELVQPDIILALGRMAAQTVLAGHVEGLDTTPLGKLRGQIHHTQGRPVVVTYHPDYLLRTPGKKGEAWYDLCLAMAHVGHNPLHRTKSNQIR